VGWKTVIPKDTLGLAGEFAAASELCRRGIYAQLTLGNRKRTDLLVEADQGMIRVQVKAKQGRVWPASRGVYGSDIVLILVDYHKKADSERPDFYILTPEDWVSVAGLPHYKLLTGLGFTAIPCGVTEEAT
jgi:hypothetical protein